mgnify:CR=1 FL=1
MTQALYKRGDNHDPIVVLAVSSLIIEHHMHNSLYAFLNESNSYNQAFVGVTVLKQH